MSKTIPFVLLLVLMIGCRTRLNNETPVKVELLDKVTTTIEPITSAQTVKVSATATTGQFNVYFYLEKDKAEVEKEIDRNKEAPKLLGRELKTATANLSATVPANERAIVLVMSGDGKKAEGKLKITN